MYWQFFNIGVGAIREMLLFILNRTTLTLNSAFRAERTGVIKLAILLLVIQSTVILTARTQQTGKQGEKRQSPAA